MLSPGPAVALDGPGSMVDVIGSIVISLSRCCLQNDEGPGPHLPNIFPRTAPATDRSVGGLLAEGRRTVLLLLCGLSWCRAVTYMTPTA